MYGFAATMGFPFPMVREAVSLPQTGQRNNRNGCVTMEKPKGRLAKHTLFTTLFSFWITGFLAGLIFQTTPGDMAVLLILGSFAIPTIVSLPIYGILVRKTPNRVLVVENKWDLRKVGAVASLSNILITVGLTVFIYWKLFGG